MCSKCTYLLNSYKNTTEVFMNTNSLYTNLLEYSQGNFYPFHMPGHKRTALPFPNPWTMDITEIDGFDNLHHAEGILKELQQRVSTLFGTKESFCLINGSTCGLLTAISACVKPGGKLLMSRNCHKSVYHSVYLRNITPVYVMPEITDFGIMGSLSVHKVKALLQEQPDIQAILVVSPTYDGVVSDITQIADLAHAHGIPLIVDEAHGAHFSFHKDFPTSAISCGADIVVQSLHKTLPAFTQTALLHLCSHRVDSSVIQRFLGIYQSSSPSYLLMASIDQCLQILTTEGPQLFRTFRKNLKDFYEKCATLQHIKVFQVQQRNTSAFFDWDDSKILISAQKIGLSGEILSDTLLKNYQIQLEMSAGHYALALSSLMDTQEGFQKLFAALWELEQTTNISEKEKSADIINSSRFYGIPQQQMTITQALESPSKTILLTDASGKISQEYLYLYPPGIPLIAPGEMIDKKLLATICKIKEQGLHLEGLSDMTNTRIKIVNF